MATTVLVERDALRAALVAQARDAAAGTGRVVLVSGEAGAGKTALVRDAFPDAVWGYCEPLSTPRPLGPFLDLVQALQVAVPARPNPAAMGGRLLGALARPGPAVVIDDAHWIDSSSADVLRFVGRRIADTCGLVVVTARDEAAADHLLQPLLGDLVAAGGLTRLDVPPLTAAGVRQVVAGRGLDVDEVLRLSAGNAFLVTQLAAAPAGELAVSLRDWAAARLTRLGVGARELVQLLSVMPGRVPGEVVGRDWRHVDELAAAGLLQVDDESVGFRHELLRLAVEAGVPPGRRRQLHADVLSRLPAATEPARVAHHARRAHRLDVALAAEVDAARRAAAFGSHREAAAHLRRAVGDAAVCASRPEHVRLLLLLAPEEAATAREESARAAAERALALATAEGDPLLRSAAARTLSRLEPEERRARELALAAVELADVAEADASGEDLEDGGSRARTGARSARAAALANLAEREMLARSLGDAVRHARSAINLSGAGQDSGTEVVACNALGSALLLQGDAAGEPALRRAIHLAAAAGNEPEVARGYANLVSAAGEARMYALSTAAAQEAERYFLARDLHAMGSYTRAWHARCLFEQGRWDDAEQTLTEIEAAAADTAAITLLLVRCLSGRLAVRRGSANPEPELHAVEQLARATGSLQRVAPVTVALAEAAWLAGRAIDVAQLREVHELALARSDAWSVGELSLWLWRAGEPITRPTMAATPFRLHVTGELRAAADAWTSIGCPYEAADALSDSDDERDLRRALQVFGELGARPQWQRTAAALRRSGARSIPRGPFSGARADGLTEREAEVLACLAAGCTDAEIAAQLHLSVRTVEHHVASVLRKKGVSGRRRLLAR